MQVQFNGMAPLLQVLDMGASLDFYMRTLDFRITDSDGKSAPEWVLLSNGSIQLMLNTAYESDAQPPKPDPLRWSGHRDVTLYFGYSRIDELYNILKERGLMVPPPTITGYGWKAFQFADPDGYGICVHWPEKD